MCHITKLGRIVKNLSHFGKMGHTGENDSHCKKSVTLFKNMLQKEWVTFGKMDHTRENGSYLEKWVTL